MKHLRRLAALAASALLLTACGSATGSASDGAAPTKAHPVTVTYGSFSTGTAARQVLVAQDKGYFADEGIKLKVTTLNSTAALGSLLASGGVDIANLSYQPAFDAVAAGINLKMLSGIQGIQPGMQTVFVRKDSGITSLKDLKGKKFGVSSLGGYGEMMLAESLKQVGLSIDDVHMVEVAPPDAAGALERGDIDAAHFASPFRAAVLTDPTSPLKQLYDFYETPSLRGLPQSALVANGKWLDANKATADAFMRAVDKAASELEANPKEDRTYLQKLGHFTAPQAKQIPLEHWTGNKDTEQSIQRVLDMMDANGQIKKDTVDLDSFTSYLHK